jgi:hypothetical protein
MTFTRRPTRPEPALPVPERAEAGAEPIVVGDTVVAHDGSVGRVERILRSENARPQFLVVSVRDRLRRRHPVVPSSLVGRVDRRRDVVHVHGDRSSIRGLSEALPLVM